MITNYDTYETEEKDDFYFLDVTLRYRFPEHWEVRAAILNLFDDRVEWVRGYLMPERNYRVGVPYTF
jgi:vitamin B12 transporter